MFVYNVQNAVQYTSHGTPGTEDPTFAMRETTRGFRIQSLFATGKANAATTISGLAFRLRRWTTAGSGGTALGVNPRHALAPAAVGTFTDKQSAITPGTVSGAYQLGFGCGKAGPGGWVARDLDSMVHVEPGSADEINVNSVSAEASLNFELNGEIVQ